MAEHDLRKLIEITRLGYGGMLPDGRIVDRREHPDALPLPENAMLGIPKPKPVEEAD